MKVILHDEETDQYYLDCNRWADKPEEGHDFPSIMEAMRENYRRRLGATEIVVISEHPMAVIPLEEDLVRTRSSQPGAGRRRKCAKPKPIERPDFEI